MASDEPQQVPISEAIRLGIDHHHAGRLQEAELIYKAILAAEPTHRGANYNLGLLALQTGRAAEAVPILKAALDADPTNAAFWLNYAVALVGSGDPRAARTVLLQARQRGLGGTGFDKLLRQVDQVVGLPLVKGQQVIPAEDAQDPPPGELSSLAQLLAQGKHAELETLAARVMEQFPRSVRLLHLLGASRLSRNLNEEGHEVLSRAGQLAPGNPEVLDLLGIALFRLGRYEQARVVFEQCLARDPGRYETLINASANALAGQDLDAARRFAGQAAALRPEGVEGMFALGNVAAESGRKEEAAELYRRAIAVDSTSADLFMNLGNVLHSLGRPDEATIALQQALLLRPDYAPAHLNLGRALHDLGESAAAQRQFRAASDLDPNLAEAHSAYLFSLAHDESVSLQHSYAEHLRIGDLLEAPLRHTWREHDNDRDPERDLRIGFVSGDLHDHPVANLIEPVWQAIKRGRNRIHVFANGSSSDEVATRLRSLVDDWVQVERMSDQALCERIRTDRIDILVDLSGHTARNRLLAFARKPAPVQVSWIGYPGTTGLSAMDYRFVRGLSSKLDDLQRQFREKLVHFQFRGFQPAAGAPVVNSLPALSRGCLTLGSFNRPSKLSGAVIALWCRVLLAIPDSRLLIAGVGEARLKERLRASFADAIAPERLEFRARLPMQEYLALHHEVDVALDTFPYAGGTTTSHSLWMGVPVLTLAGPSMQQNQTTAILGMLGLSDWVVDSGEAYVSRACAVAADLQELSSLRSGLRERVSQYFLDVQNEAGADLDAAFRTIWRRWCAREQPARFTVPN